jgi:hypothetical protein
LAPARERYASLFKLTHYRLVARTEFSVQPFRSREAKGLRVVAGNGIVRRNIAQNVDETNRAAAAAAKLSAGADNSTPPGSMRPTAVSSRIRRPLHEGDPFSEAFRALKNHRQDNRAQHCTACAALEKKISTVTFTKSITREKIETQS